MRYWKAQQWEGFTNCVMQLTAAGKFRKTIHYHFCSRCQHSRKESERRRLYSPSGAGKQRHNVPEPVEQRAQCSLAQVNRGGEGRRGRTQVGAGNKPQWDIPIHIWNDCLDTTAVKTRLTCQHLSKSDWWIRQVKERFLDNKN